MPFLPQFMAHYVVNIENYQVIVDKGLPSSTLRDVQVVLPNQQPLR